MSDTGDYISRESLLSAAEGYGWKAGLKTVLKRIPAADVRLRWIPVKEQLIHSGWYLVACNEWGGSAVRKAIYDEATRKWLEFPCGGPKDITKFVTHYMPLPEPPKELIGTDMGGGIRRDDAGNVIDWGITGPPGDVGKTEEEWT